MGIKKNKHKLIIVVGILCILSIIVYLFLYTTSGSRFITNILISKYIEYGELDYKNSGGNLAEGLNFENLELKNLKGLPEGTNLRIQKLFINLTSLSINGIYVKVENVRLRLPDSDPIVISGTFKEKNLDLNIFSKGFTVTEVLSYLPDFKKLIPIKGDVNEIDLFVRGPYLESTVKGHFVIEKFIYKSFLLTNTPVKVDVQLKDVKDKVKVFGAVALEKGELHTKKVMVKLDSGDLKFSGPWNQPHINIKGTSKVEKTKISIGLKGTVEKPELTLSSEPSQSRQKLMIMLATGKSWQSVDDSIDNGLNSTALTKDFVDYFFFAGKSNQFAKRFGVSDFSIKFDQNNRGISAKKELSEKLEVGYGVEQSNGRDQSKNVSQKLEGEYKINEKVSVGIEREMTKKQADGLLDEQKNENDDKVMLKYKKNF